MSRAFPTMQIFAKRLMALEAGGDKSYRTKMLIGFHVCEKLHPNLAVFMGKTGFHALLTRSLALTALEFPWLRTVRVKDDWSLDGLEELQMQISQDELFSGGVALLAHLLELLVTFIGEVFTVRLVRVVWPKVSVDDLDLGVGGEE